MEEVKYHSVWFFKPKLTITFKEANSGNQDLANHLISWNPLHLEHANVGSGCDL
jgi:hypothetical protein